MTRIVHIGWLPRDQFDNQKDHQNAPNTLREKVRTTLFVDKSVVVWSPYIRPAILVTWFGPCEYLSSKVKSTLKEIKFENIEVDGIGDDTDGLFVRVTEALLGAVENLNKALWGLSR